MAGIFLGRAVLTMPENVGARQNSFRCRQPYDQVGARQAMLRHCHSSDDAIFNNLYGHRVRCRDDDAISARDWTEPPLSIDLTYTSNPSYYPRRGGTR